MDHTEYVGDRSLTNYIPMLSGNNKQGDSQIKKWDV